MNFRDQLKKLGTKSSSIICLCVDFDLPNISWEDNSVQPNSQNSTIAHTLLDLMNDSSLSQLVNSPTRGKNILDLYFTNNPTLARQVKMIPGIGDHHSASMVDSLIKPMVNKLQSRKVYQYHKGDWDSIKAGLTSFAPKFRSDCQKMNIDEMWNSFHSKMMSL